MIDRRETVGRRNIANHRVFAIATTIKAWADADFWGTCSNVHWTDFEAKTGLRVHAKLTRFLPMGGTPQKVLGFLDREGTEHRIRQLTEI